MLNEFMNFIKNDPIMLGLSCAIVFLVFIFILVLIFGGKKKTKAVEENAIDNTSALLKTDLESEPLKSTQEFTLNMNIEKNEETPVFDNAVKPIQVQEETVKPIEKALEPIAQEPVIPIPVETSAEVPVMNVEETAESVIPQVVPEVNSFDLPQMNEVHDEPMSSVYLGDNNIENSSTPETKEEDLDDIELPMLNTNKDTSVLSSLQGEHYNI